MLMRVVAILAALAAADVAAGHAQAPQIGGVGIAVFSDSNYRGRNATFRTDTPDLGPYGLNDRISSLRVAPGELWEVCEHANYGGRCQVFSGGDPDLGRSGWSDTITSLRRVTGGADPPAQPPRGGIELFSNTRFRGERRFLTDAVSDLRRVGFDNDAESVRLDSQAAWEICADANFRNCRVVTGDVADLDDIGLSERVSSVRPLDRNDDGRPPSTGGPQRLVLFDDRQYRGRAFNVDDEMPSLPGFGSRAESVQVFGGIWELCDETRFRGRCVSVTANVVDLAALGLRNRVKSVRPR